MSFHYTFKLLNKQSFECRLSMEASGKLWGILLDKSLKGMRMAGYHVSDDVTKIDRIVITRENTKSEIITVLEKSLGKLFWKVADLAAKDGYKCLDFALSECIYERKAGCWHIEAVLRGDYLKG